jgi:hypothetical protein
MKKGLIVVLVFMAFFAEAQVTHRNILASKYSLEQVKQLLVDKSDYHPFPQTVAQWKAAVPDSILQKMIKEGESALNFKFEPISATVSLKFVRNGDRSEHADVSFTKRIKLKQLILAESVENKGRFTEAILNGVWSICEESFWGVPAHLGNVGLPDVDNPIVELFSAETAALLAMTDYFVGEKLDKENKLFRKRIYSEINKRVFEPMRTTSTGYGWMSKTKPVNNWNPWIHSNLIMAALLIEKDKDKRAKMIYEDMKGVDLYLNGLGDEGGCDEGPSYWFAAGASVYDCLEFLTTATNGKIDVYDNSLIKKMASYIYKMHIGEKYFVNFSDADPQFIPDGLMLYRFGKAINDPYLVNMGTWSYKHFNNLEYATPHSNDDFHRPRYVQNILTIASMPMGDLAYNPPPNVWISDVQALAARSSYGLYLATHGGHNAESHNHNDVGDFIVYSNNEPVLIDAGRGNYTARTFSPQRYELWFTQSQHHNLPIINGYGQLAGKEFAATNVKNQMNDNHASLTMDIAGAYDTLAGVKYWNRKVMMDRSINQIQINDSYSMNRPLKSLQQVFMTVCDINIAVPGEIALTTPAGQHFVIRYDKAKWLPTIEHPSTEGAEYSSFKFKWGGRTISRIILSRTTLKNKDAYSFLIDQTITLR